MIIRVTESQEWIFLGKIINVSTTVTTLVYNFNWNILKYILLKCHRITPVIHIIFLYNKSAKVIAVIQKAKLLF